jgi:hypothetical protein
MKPFEFHAELFEFRNAAMEALSENGFVWLSDFGSIDLMQDIYGLEATGIREEADAKEIAALLRKIFPAWRCRRTYYKDVGREIGWKVMISRDTEDRDDDWQHAP